MGQSSAESFGNDCKQQRQLGPHRLCYPQEISLSSHSSSVASPKFAHSGVLKPTVSMATTSDIDFTRRNKKPRPLSETERERLEEFIESIHYSSRYSDDEYEYRHVQLPKQMLKAIPKEYFDGARGTLKLLWEEEWRGLGITQSLGWEHYEVHEPEPHILLFKRPINYQPPMHQ